jgi:hypothetical protein
MAEVFLAWREVAQMSRRQVEKDMERNQGKGGK